MNLIIETDCGHDADDFFTICWLAAAGVNIRAIVITPGDLDQISTARMLIDELELDIPIGFHKESNKLSSKGIHKALRQKYGYPEEDKGDGFGYDIISHTMHEYPDCEWFVIGPPSNVGRYLERDGTPTNRCTMQGGFLGYDLHDHAKVRLDKFSGKTWMPTFNMNGDRKGTVALASAAIGERRFCGKNVCHSVVFEHKHLSMLKIKNRASELFVEAASLLFARTSEKKFHDPVAAVCHLHPHVGTWVRGKPTKMGEGWGTVLDENGDYILANIDYDKFWEHISEFS